MSQGWRIAVWLVGSIVFGILLHLLSSILFPFVIAAIIAYFLDPLADRLESVGFSRVISTIITLSGCFLFIIGAGLLLIPALKDQIFTLVRLVPLFFDIIKSWIEPIFLFLQNDMKDSGIDELKKAATEQVGTAVNWLSGFVGGIWSGGVAFFNMLSLILITPLVAFYLLRDWDILVAKINSWLPLDAAPIIREQALQIDKTMAGFIRGQACVCLVLAVYYALALSILGLKAGLLIGIISGILAFVPFIGWAVAFFVSLAMSLTQFEHFLDITFVGIVMIFGALLESYILTPKLVGGRVGLSPIWIIFSMLAGGALFGFLGVLLAVPVAAIIGVLIRFWLNRYLKSVLYLGHDHGFKD